MVVAIRLVNCNEARITDNNIGPGASVGIELNDSKNVFMNNNISRHATGKRFGNKVRRNETCPCGSGIKYKKCCSKDEDMSVGIRANRSTFKVGKANIVADVGVDLIDSEGYIDHYNHVDPNAPQLQQLLSTLVSRPPEELITEAMREVKVSGDASVLERSKLHQWCAAQSINAAFWAQLVAAIGIAVLGG